MHVLIEAAPLDPVTGTRATVRAASAQDPAITALNNQAWWPAVLAKPSLGLKLFDGDFTSDVDPGTASLALALDALERATPNVRRFVWAGAAVTIYAGESGQAWPWEVAFTGRVDRFEQRASRLDLTAAVDTEPFDADVLTATYAGTTGIEGGGDLKGRLKPLVLGYCSNVEPVLIDAVDNIYQFSAYGPMLAIGTLYERGADFGPAVGNYASFAALKAAAIPAGRWAACSAQGLVRLGAPAYGVITGDVAGVTTGGFTDRTGAMIQRAASIAGTPANRIAAATFTALDTAHPYSAGIVVTEQTSVLELARRLCRPLNAVVGVSWQGQLFATKITIGPPALSLDAQGRQMPPVLSSTEVDVTPPYKRIVFGAARAWRVHSFEEVAFTAQLVDRGAYAAGETYREGNIVQDQGSTWLYINPAATAGNAPPTLPTTENAYWRVLARAGQDGVSAYAILLTNESHVLPAGADGTVLTYNGASTNVVVYAAGADVSASFALSVASNPQALAVGIVDKTATVTGGLDPGEPNATLLLRMTGSGPYAGVVLDKQFSLTKSRAGADGNSPPLITVAASAQTVRYDGADLIVSGDIDVTTVRTSSIEAPRFTITSIDGSVHGQAGATAAQLRDNYGNSFGSTGPDHLLLKQAWLNAVMQGFGGEVRIVAEVTGAADTVTLVKVRDGEDATVLAMELSATGAAFDAAGVLKTGDVTAAVTRQNVPGPTLFTLQTEDGTFHGGTPDRTAAQLVAASPTSFASSGPDNLVLKAAWIATVLGGSYGRRVTVTAKAGGEVASASVVRVNDGEPGTPGADAYAVEVSVASFTVACDYLGNVKPGALPLPFTVKVAKGPNAVTGSAAISFTGSAGVTTASPSAASNALATIGGSDGYLNVHVTIDGIVFDPVRLPIVKRLDPAPPSNPDQAFRGFSANVLSMTFDEANTSNVATSVIVGAGGTINAIAAGQYFAPSDENVVRSIRIAGKLQYRPAGTSSWLDMGVAQEGTVATYRPLEGAEPGYLDVSASAGGLIVGSNVEVRVITRITLRSGTITTSIVGGILSAQAA